MDLIDRNGHLRGKIVREGGKEVLYSREGYLLGNYDPKDGRTYKRGGILVGTGNLLTTLLK